ncbi:MAG: hypothetical protein GYB67_01175 [Chloroflexi bacterium]|nr:hypothetical protein [Chloroflexota bacterium]
MLKPQHSGLYFTQSHIEHAQTHADQEPFAGAWAYLRSHEKTGSAAAVWGGLRYRFSDHAAAGSMAVALLQRHIDPTLIEGMTDFDAIAETLMLAQAFEMVRDHPDFADSARAAWLRLFERRVGALNDRAHSGAYHAYLWLVTLNFAAGVVLERDALIDEATAAFKQVIAAEVRPQGFITQAVEPGDGLGLYRQILAAAALVLTAEAARHIGLDLWNYAVRGVSVVTAALYPIYYFYTTDKWQWDEAVSVEDAQGYFRAHGGFLEMVNQHAPHRDLKTLLADLRPIGDVRGGGLTTLTHGTLEKKRRGLFG